MSNTIDPAAELEALEAETERIAQAVFAARELVDRAKDAERDDARHLQFLNDELRTARAEAKRIAGECFTAIRANDSTAVPGASEKWTASQRLIDFIAGALTNTYGVLAQHRIQTLSVELGAAQEQLRDAKHKEKMCELELLCLVGDAAERQGGVTVSSTLLDECRRRTAACAAAAEGAQVALDQQLKQQRDSAAQSYGTVSFNNR